MAHIDLPDAPGIVGLLMFRPETAAPLNQLAEVLLRSKNSLTVGERELIAAYVSHLNRCSFCERSHSACAAAQLQNGASLVERVKCNPGNAPISDKLRALLGIAAKVQQSGLSVRADDIRAAREAQATDLEIHDTVLIAAAFCMFNRYVDGLGTRAPAEHTAYEESARRVVAEGYARSPSAPAAGGA